MTDSDMNYVKVRGIVIGGLLLRMIAGAIYGHTQKKNLTSGKKLSAEDIPKVLKAVGAPPMPAKPMPGLDNAFYAPPGMAKHPLMPLTDDERKQAEKTGFIAYDPKYRSEAIISHESGHAEIANRPWHSGQRINQSFLRPAGSLVGALSLVPGYMVATGTRNLGLGMLTSAATAAIGSLPTLFNEYKASKLGLSGLDSMYEQDSLKEHVAARRKKRNSKALKSALSTYAFDAGLDTLISGAGLAALLHDEI